jgi:DNA-directed RNA polymerases I, II, and III subunit RPABC2
MASASAPPPPVVHASKTLTSLSDIMKNYDPKKNVTKPVITKYERAIVLGQRIEQLARGAPPFVDAGSLSSTDQENRVSPEMIAERELLERKLPFVIKRTLPNGKAEYWRIEDMIVF